MTILKASRIDRYRGKRTDLLLAREAIKVCNLHANHKSIVQSVLGDILNGVDVREAVGTKPRRGRPRNKIDLNLRIALQYWFLRNRGLAQKKALGAVAELNNLSDSRVRGIADPQRARIERVLEDFYPEPDGGPISQTILPTLRFL